MAELHEGGIFADANGRAWGPLREAPRLPGAEPLFEFAGRRWDRDGWLRSEPIGEFEHVFVHGTRARLVTHLFDAAPIDMPAPAGCRDGDAAEGDPAGAVTCRVAFHLSEPMTICARALALCEGYGSIDAMVVALIGDKAGEVGADRLFRAARDFHDGGAA